MLGFWLVSRVLDFCEVLFTREFSHHLQLLARLLRTPSKVLLGPSFITSSGTITTARSIVLELAARSIRCE